MAAAFTRAVVPGDRCPHDRHPQRPDLAEGFPAAWPRAAASVHGDVLGAGEGWAKSILFHDRALAEFTEFFRREDTFASACATAAR